MSDLTGGHVGAANFQEEMSDDDQTNSLANSMKLTIETEKMIHSVHSKECLWNRFDLRYKDKNAREKAWAEVYKENFPGYDTLKEKHKARIGQQISKKWFNCRDAYVKSMKEVQRGKRPYIYTNILRFLDPVISEKTVDHNVFLDDQSFEDQSAWLPTSFVDVDESSNKKPKLDTSKDYLEVNNSEGDNLVSIIARLVNREDDEDRAFFTSIVPSVKSLTETAKLEFKIRVLKLLKDVKMKDKVGGFVKSRDSDTE